MGASETRLSGGARFSSNQCQAQGEAMVKAKILKVLGCTEPDGIKCAAQFTNPSIKMLREKYTSIGTLAHFHNCVLILILIL